MKTLCLMIYDVYAVGGEESDRTAELLFDRVFDAS